ncbi:MAG: hypothetical protein HY064_11985 [Bacteroidetes bacterium]|nr:hypothetical protein [Bacteroidota bacterium]
MRKLLLFIFIFFSLADVIAQDSIPEGIIVVRRPLIPVAYTVSINYDYGEYGVATHVDKISRNEIVLSDSARGILPPSPVNVDSSFMNAEMLAVLREHGSLNNDSFNWNTFLLPMHYGFSWSDTVRFDSAQFAVQIDENGLAGIKLMPWKIADSTTIAFEKKSFDRMRKCSYWYPARYTKKKRRKLRTKNIPSYLLITVYARDAGAGRMKPLEVIDH